MKLIRVLTNYKIVITHLAIHQEREFAKQLPLLLLLLFEKVSVGDQQILP
jgi:hypothetical protein